MLQFCREELEGETALPAGVVGDLDEAPERLVVSQEDVQRVAEGLDTPSKEQSRAGKCCSGGHSWPALSPGEAGGSLSFVLSAWNVRKSVPRVSPLPRRWECIR